MLRISILFLMSVISDLLLEIMYLKSIIFISIKDDRHVKIMNGSGNCD